MCQRRFFTTSMAVHTTATLGILFAHWEHVATVAAPVGPDIRHAFKPVRDPMIDLLFIRIPLIVRLGNTLCDHFLVTFLVASVFAVGALHARRVFEEFPTKSATHDVVKLLLDEFVAIHLVNLFFARTNSSLPPKAEVQRTLVPVEFGFARLVFENTIGIAYSPKFIERWICPTGSSANHASALGVDDVVAA